MSFALTVLAMTMVAASADSAAAREERMWKAVQAQEMDLFRSELDDEFLAVYSIGTNDKAGEVASLERQTLQSFTLRDFIVRTLSDSVELVTYTASVKGSYEGADISGDYRATSIWKRESGAWKLAYHSEMRAQ